MRSYPPLLIGVNLYRTFETFGYEEIFIFRSFHVVGDTCVICTEKTDKCSQGNNKKW